MANSFFLFAFLFSAISQHLPDRIRAVGLEDLVKVGGYAVVCHAAVPENGIAGLHLRNGLDRFVRHVVVKAGQQETVRQVL